MAVLPIEQPPTNVLSKGAGRVHGLLLDPSKGIWLLVASGALTNGTSGDGAGWAGKGTIVIRSDTGVAYSNTNTILSPTWTKVSGT